MDDRTLVRKLKSLKRELLAIKTAHARGLGTASFDSMTGYVLYHNMAYETPYLKVTAKFADTVVASPFAQCYISNARYFQPVTIKWNPTAHSVVFVYMCYLNNLSIDVYSKVIATAGIESVTMESVEYGEF